MASDRKKPGVAFWATVAVVMGLVGYVCAYALLAEPGVASIDFSGGLDMKGPVAVLRQPYYFAGSRLLANQQLLERFFAPIHWIDRCVRPNVWNWRFPD